MQLKLRVRGFSLVELMVAMVAGLILVAAVITLFASILKANSTAMKVSRLNQELQSVTDMIARDIQRAGYDASAAAHTLVSGASSPFYFDSTQHLLNKYSSSPDKFRCIALKYDERDENAAPSPGQPGAKEAVVYSYRSTSTDSSIWLNDLSASASLATLTAACGNGGERVSTDGVIEITDLSFTLLLSSRVSGSRAIQLNISGRYKDNTELRLDLQRDIKLRNNGY
ncbi:prepilin-type N-terminal cleavage/methylation domain-containing protein [Aeromonas caviae]|uniref:prepilin-type N-terminal cleavage/methylation domain-containing protein n=1 Tax=Aeromonas caviae TaxID=648 RepID=UPI0038D2549E